MGKGRTPCCDKTGLKKGPWTPLEDQKLISFIETYGHNNWRALPKQAGLLRCGKSCRLRWINYLRPDIKRGNFTREEEETIIRLHESLGNKWSFIASHLPGRTDNEIKNVWNTHLKKRVPSKVTYPAKDKSTISSISTSSPSSTSTSSSTSNNSMLSHSIYSTNRKIEVKEELAHTQQESMEKEASVQPLINSDSRISDSTGNIGNNNGMVVQSSTWMVPSKSTNPSLEEAIEVVSSPNSCSTCSSSYISHLEQLVVEGSAKSVQDLAPDQQQQFNKSDNTPFELIDLDPFGEIVEIPFEPDILDMLDDELCFLPSTNVDPLPGTGGIHQQKQQQQMGSGEVSKEVESRNWVSYLEDELGLQETDENHEQKRMSVTIGKGFETQESTTGPFIDEDKILMETEIDPVSMYFEMWPSSPCRL